MATRMATGVGKGAAWECGRSAAEAALAELGGNARPDLVVVFASPHHDHGEVLKGVRTVTGAAPLIGCSSAGEFTEKGVLSGSVVVSVVSSDSMRFTVGCGRRLKESLSRAVAEAVTDFRGSSPEAFRAGLVHRTILLFTDGLDREGGTGLDDAARRLRASCRRLVWLNPLLRYDGYQPLAAGARALAAHVGEMRACHNLASLEGLAAALGERRPAPTIAKAA